MMMCADFACGQSKRCEIMVKPQLCPLMQRWRTKIELCTHTWWTKIELCPCSHQNEQSLGCQVPVQARKKLALIDTWVRRKICGGHWLVVGSRRRVRGWVIGRVISTECKGGDRSKSRKLAKKFIAAWQELVNFL